MSKKYDVEYHLAAGVIVGVSGVDQSDVDKLAPALENDNSVITVGGHDTKKIQFIPVRNILLIQVKEVKE